MIDEKEEQIQDMKNEGDELKALLSQATSRTDEKETHMFEMEEKLLNLNVQLEEYKENIESLNVQLKEYKEKIESLNVQLEEHKTGSEIYYEPTTDLFQENSFRKIEPQGCDTTNTVQSWALLFCQSLFYVKIDSF